MRLLILGTGMMAATHVREFSALDGVDVTGCVDVDPEKAEAFARTHGIAKVHATLADAVESGLYDAIANTTPDAAHFATTMDAISAGLHVFCEKPLATNAADADQMTEAANLAGIVHGVNLTYRNVSALQKARDMIVAGVLGDIRHFEAAYLQSWLTQPAWGDWRTDDKWLWRLSTAHGSTGVLGDIGIHILDFACFAAGSDIRSLACKLKTFDKAPGNRIGSYHLDANDSMVMTAELTSGATGVLHASRFATGHMNDLSLRVFGTKGGMIVTNQGPLGTLSVCAGEDSRTAAWRSIDLEPIATNYHRFTGAVISKEKMMPDFGVAARLQAVIDGALRSNETGRGITVDR